MMGRPRKHLIPADLIGLQEVHQTKRQREQHDKKVSPAERSETQVSFLDSHVLVCGFIAADKEGKEDDQENSGWSVS